MAITQVSNSLVKQDLTISGGTVDNTVIGSGTPAAGTFTTVAGTLASTVTGTTAAASDNSTKIATTAYVTTAIANLVDTAPSALNTLNELAAALGDDANFATTVNSSIAAKLPLAGGTLTGATTINGGNPPLVLSNSGDAKVNFVRSSNTINYAMSSSASGGHGFYDNAGSAYDLYMKAGNVGIGTTTPASLLTINGTDPLITFENGESPHWQLGFENTQSDRFVLYDNNSSAYRLVVDNSGNVLIGKTTTALATAGLTLGGAGFASLTRSGAEPLNVNRLSDDGKLAVFYKDSVEVGSMFTNGGALVVKGASTSAPVQLQTHDGNEDIEVDPDGFIKMETGGSERLRITAGKVSIGTTAVASATNASLHVADPSVDVQAVFGDNLASIDDPQIRVIGRDSANSAIRYLFTGLDADANHGFIGYNAGAGAFQNAFTFNTSGHVGVGTTTLNKFFNMSDPAQGGEQIKLHFEASSGADLWNIYSYDRTNGHYTNMLLGQYFYLQGSSGNVGIGTTNPQNKLHIQTGSSGYSWTVDSGDNLMIEANTSVIANIITPNGNNGVLMFSDADARGRGQINYSHTGDDMYIMTAGTTSLHLPSNKYLVAQGASQVRLVLGSTGNANNNSSNWIRGSGTEVDINTAGGNFNIEVGGNKKVTVLSGGGITFNGDTAAANALDDFEEGTWTPSLSAGGHTVTQVNFARYTKIKNFVQCICYVSIGGTGNGANLTLAGLPFAVTTNAFGVGVSDMEYQPVGTYIRAQSSTSQAIFLVANGSSTGRSVIIGTQINVGYGIFNFSYYTS